MVDGLDLYATSLCERSDLVWPKPPAIEPFKAKAGSFGLKGIRCVMWGTYGTLLHVASGDLLFEHPKEFVTNLALEKTIQEFRMWGSMSRKPGQPSDSLLPIYRNLIFDLKAGSGLPGEKFPELASERVWEAVIQKLQKKDYVIDHGKYGSTIEFARKIAFFFHTALQGANVYPGSVATISDLASRGILQGLLGNGQCFTTAQLKWGLKNQQLCDPEVWFCKDLCVLSGTVGARKPSNTLFQAAANAAKNRGLLPEQVLHIGSKLREDLIGAKKVGFKTALFLGDKSSSQVEASELKDPETRPDALITSYQQLLMMLAG